MTTYNESGDQNGNISSGDTFNGSVGDVSLSGIDTQDNTYLGNMEAGQAYTFTIDLSHTSGVMEFAILDPFTSEGSRLFLTAGQLTEHSVQNSSIGTFSPGALNGTVITFNFTPAYAQTFVLETTAHALNSFDYSASFVEFEPITEGPDVILGTSGDDDIAALGGDDIVDGLEGNDTIDGQAGNDALTGGAGNDVFVVGLENGADIITDFTSGADQIDVTAYGVTTIDELTITDSLDGAVIDLGDGNQVTLNGVSADSLSDADFVLSPSIYEGTAGEDHAKGDSRIDHMSGGGDDDQLYGEGGNDILWGDAGKDKLHGGDGNDTMDGGAGNDLLKGDAGADVLNGGDKNDRLHGGNDNDVLNGGTGNDKLYGDAGDDLLNGGTGKDVMAGGSGADTFVFNAGSHADTITDFEDGSDLLDFSGHAGITGMGDLKIGQNGNDVIINHGGNDEITLKNVDVADIDITDFVF